MTAKYKKGQKVKGPSGVRTIVKVTATRIYWTNGKAKGVCSTETFRRWITGR